MIARRLLLACPWILSLVDHALLKHRHLLSNEIINALEAILLAQDRLAVDGVMLRNLIILPLGVTLVDRLFDWECVIVVVVEDLLHSNIFSQILKVDKALDHCFLFLILLFLGGRLIKTADLLHASFIDCCNLSNDAHRPLAVLMRLPSSSAAHLPVLDPLSLSEFRLDVTVLLS